MITVTGRRIVEKYHRIWCDAELEEGGLDCVRSHDSLSQEEYKRLIDLGVIDKEGYITKLFPLPRITIRPVGFS